MGSSFVRNIGTKIHPILKVRIGDQQRRHGVVADITFGIFVEQSERNGVLDNTFDDSLCDVLSDRGRNFLVRSGAVQRYKVLDAIMLNDLERSGGAMLN